MIQNKEIMLRPVALFAFMRVFPLVMLAIVFLLTAWWLSPLFIPFSFGFAGLACYRFLLIRNCRYLIEAEFIRMTSGILFKRTEQVELYRVKDYTITRPFLHQLIGIMDLTLKTTDPGNALILLRAIPLSGIVDVIRERVQRVRQHNRIYDIN
jgi:uncharacterized membrane protein YdbT with pleckstrin-like domain